MRSLESCVHVLFGCHGSLISVSSVASTEPLVCAASAYERSSWASLVQPLPSNVVWGSRNKSWWNRGAVLVKGMSGVVINRLQRTSPVEQALGPSAHPKQGCCSLVLLIDVNTTSQPQMGRFVGDGLRHRGLENLHDTHARSSPLHLQRLCRWCPCRSRIQASFRFPSRTSRPVLQRDVDGHIRRLHVNIELSVVHFVCLVPQ
ncbi:hypothetical protein IWZ03DRAFT_233849 [Phyllosticta citriasiana]|uniref:Secreted protein n=1 Tax=Phyllosticta citriasiana TaxID=595635 RepID=A0ABR1KK80_9PEZI